MKYSKIIGTGSFLPDKVLSNFDLEKLTDTTDEWIVTRTGIHNRHVATPQETPSFMAEMAARKALEAANITATDLDLIIVATVTPEKYFPSTACLLQNRLHASSCMSFDINAACSGFVYGLNIADQFIKAGTAQRVLVVGAEGMTSFIDWNDRNTCVLFGDGSGAAVIAASDEPGILASRVRADGNVHDILYYDTELYCKNKECDEPRKINMKGRELYKLAIERMVNAAREVIVAADLQISDIDWLIPHQANQRIIEMVIKKLRIPREKVILTIGDQANTSSASVPLALDYAIRNDIIKPGQKVIVDAFGAGLAWGAILFTL